MIQKGGCVPDLAIMSVMDACLLLGMYKRLCGDVILILIYKEDADALYMMMLILFYGLKDYDPVLAIGIRV